MTHSRPRMSIVTPSYNQAQFLEETIMSVLNQGYPDLEYVVIDGGSRDGSIDVIRRHQHQLAYWVSEPDGGQYEAINKGFAKTTGEIMAWLNSDDKYLPSAFSTVGEIFAAHPHVEWVTTVHPLTWNERGQAVGVDFTGAFNARAFYRGSNLPIAGTHGRRWIQQESTFWRRSLWERAGGRLDVTFPHAADFELWARFFQHAELYGVNALLGGFRAHGDQKSLRFREPYVEEAKTVLRAYRQWPGNRGERAVRELLWKLVRQYSLGDVPRWLRSGLEAVGLFHPAPVITWTGKEWEITSGFVL